MCKYHKPTFQRLVSNECVYACEQVVRKCNEGARTMERTEMMYTINSQLEFKIKVRTYLLLSGGGQVHP